MNKIYKIVYHDFEFSLILKIKEKQNKNEFKNMYNSCTV